MKTTQIIFLSKRHPQNRDIYLSPYGRFYFIPKILSEYNYECHLVLGNYQPSKEIVKTDGKLNIHSINLFPNPFRYIKYINKIIKNPETVWIVGSSDTYFGIIASWISRKTGAKVLIDAYDNYESYIPWALPLHWLWRNSLKKSDYISAAGPHLLNRMSKGRANSEEMVLPMSADPIFFKRDMYQSRARLKLPTNKKLVGYIGSAYKNRGIDTFITAIQQIRKERPDILFVMSGFISKGLKLPDNVIHLGYIDSNSIPYLINSVDMCVAINLESNFGNYSYPVKIYEAMASQTKIIASKTLATEWILRKHPELLFKSKSPSSLVYKIYEVINPNFNIYFETQDWNDQIGRLISKIFEN